MFTKQGFQDNKYDTRSHYNSKCICFFFHRIINLQQTPTSFLHFYHFGTFHEKEEVEVGVREWLSMQDPSFYSDRHILGIVLKHTDTSHEEKSYI
jgi:hypothetical protein